MALQNALDYVQRGLLMVDANNVSAITDSVESTQVFTLLKNVYDELLDEYPWPHLRQIMNLQVTATNHIMKLPVDVLGFNWVRYNKKNVTYIEPLEMQTLLDSRDTTLATVDSNGAINNRDPLFWTSDDDENIKFDSYNVNLQSGLSKIEAIRKPASLETDTDVPDITERMQGTLRNLLFAECLRILKADETRANLYSVKARTSLSKLKRWAERYNRSVSVYGDSYDRKFGSTTRGYIDRINEV